MARVKANGVMVVAIFLKYFFCNESCDFFFRIKFLTQFLLQKFKNYFFATLNRKQNDFCSQPPRPTGTPPKEGNQKTPA